MGVMGQGLVLMVFGMTVVYLFLWLMMSRLFTQFSSSEPPFAIAGS